MIRKGYLTKEKKEWRTNLSKYYKYVKICSRQGCGLSYGADTKQDTANNVCPKCSWRGRINNIRFRGIDYVP